MVFALQALPQAWKTSVTRVTGAGRDVRGNKTPGVKSAVDGCLLAPNTTEEERSLSDVTTTRATLYAPVDSTWATGDQVITPAESVLPGRWDVDGDPIRWPAGWRINLIRHTPTGGL
ncbi:hypothetical protein [Actinobaculum sp. 352]|uniref:hypothetical protein n=1 Tax=Actinobaculum sp. 352 TaxID=2490946 RepID=UPI000F7EC493|nr:hypothetical protein [Actinobaculum sp. 352]RTE48824.1 hypothetical protein EKN07_08965 [Actinobaculum sp. 352]